MAIEIAPEQRTKIKQYVMKERVSPVTISEWVSVGATLPANIELRTVPADWGDERQRLPSLFCRTTSPSVPNTGHTLKLFALVEGFGLLGGFSALSGLGAAIFRVHFSRGFES